MSRSQRLVPPWATRRSGAWRHAYGNDGFTAIELTLGLAVLLIPTALLVLTLPTWIEIESGARAAARSAARAAVLSDDLGHIQAHAEAVASNQLGFRRGALDRLELGGSLVPGGAVEARVTVTYPALDIPLVGAVGSFRHTTTHREPVDLHRSFR